MNKYVFLFFCTVLIFAEQEVIYSKPGQSVIGNRLVELILKSKNADLCFYNFTLFPVAEAIIERQKAVPNFARLIVNHGFRQEHCEALHYLIENKAGCYAHNSGSEFSHMHCKFGCLKMQDGKDLVWHGSWNCTGQADLHNVEVVTIMDDKKVVKDFRFLFKDILNSKGTKIIHSAECIGKLVKGSGAAKILNKIPPRLWHR